MREAHGVAIILTDPEGRVLMQHRDDRPDIPFPDHWSVATGGIRHAGPIDWEVASANAAREIAQELAFELSPDDLERGVCEVLEKPTFHLVRWVMRLARPVTMADLAPVDARGRVREGQNWRFFSEAEIFDGLLVPPTILMLLERHFGRRPFGFLTRDRAAARTFAGELAERFGDLDRVRYDEATRPMAEALGWPVADAIDRRTLVLLERDPPAPTAEAGGLATLYTEDLDAARLSPTHLRFITPRAAS